MTKREMRSNKKLFINNTKYKTFWEFELVQTGRCMKKKYKKENSSPQKLTYFEMQLQEIDMW